MDEGLVLVVSRPCNAMRAGRLVVAEVVKRSLAGLKTAETLAEMKSFFITVRDGEGRPDTFYLGELAPGTDRYFAKLDSLRTIQIPEDAGGRQAFTKRHRRFRMNPEFARDLHVRLFKAFASLGFDDDGWWTDADLKLVVEMGEAEMALLDAAVRSLEARVRVLHTDEGNKKEFKQIEEELKAKRPALESASKELEPLLRELKRRGLRQ